MKTYLMTWAKVSLVLFGMLIMSKSLVGMDQISHYPPEIKITHHCVKTIEEAVQLICHTWGGNGVAVAFDFDDTLFSKETKLENGQTIRYLEKSSFSDQSLNNGVHPVFKAVNDHLGLNLVETDQSFRSIRRHFMNDSPNLPLNEREQRYYSVEECNGIEQLKKSIEFLKSQGALVCIVSAAGGEINSTKMECASNLGFSDDQFLRGHKKLEQLIKFIDKPQSQDSHDQQNLEVQTSEIGNGQGQKQDNDWKQLLQYKSGTPIHTLVLIDDTQSYINAWKKHAQTVTWSQNSRIQPSQYAGAINIVGIHYDFLGQHPDFLEQKMIEEFLGLYGEDYRSNPLMQSFINTKALSNKKENTSWGLLSFFGK